MNLRHLIELAGEGVNLIDHVRGAMSAFAATAHSTLAGFSAKLNFIFDSFQQLASRHTCLPRPIERVRASVCTNAHQPASSTH